MYESRCSLSTGLNTDCSMNVVVVESPAKAKTINKYLGSDYTVLASYGHVRDLPSKDGSVQPDQDFAMTWEVESKSKKHLDTIAKALKGAENLYLATDPDREGEAISWHIAEILKQRRGLENIKISRVVFHEITRNAILEAMAHPRELDHALVEAYLARRTLDYLFGFTLSPVLWRKLPGSRSAGRVQSVALRLICEREAEVECFRPQEYWTVEGTFRTPSGAQFSASLAYLNGEKLDKFSLADTDTAEKAEAAAKAENYSVASVERKTVKRNPYPPFTTSTLQQEASRKLGLGTSRTMNLAQRLYEGVTIGGETQGLITYMRTDSVTLAGEAVAGCRQLIGEKFGGEYLPDAPRMYRTKAKNAQEAHEAIRPTDPTRTPQNVAGHLDRDQHRLYELIWKRTIASQMATANIEKVGVDLESSDRKTRFRATGSVILFDGFLKLYQEGRDDTPDENADERILPAMEEGEAHDLVEAAREQHFTKPPPRYSEASLVKKLEELGIGRPSTYASIIDVLQARNYVHLERKRFIPEDRGRIVTAFLENFFQRYVQYTFTADLENQLDDISGGLIDWKKVLENFWSTFTQAVEDASGYTVRQVIDALDEELGPHFFPEKADGTDSRVCLSCTDGHLGLKLSKTGGFIGCSNYPDCTYTRSLAVGNGGEGGAESGPRNLGADEQSGQEISLRKGPYGFYVQLGEGEKDKKPKRKSLPRTLSPDSVDLAAAQALLALPRTVGAHPESGKTITADIGPYGPYLKHDGAYTSLKGDDDDVLTVGINRAVDLISRSRKGGGGSGRELGAHPDDGKPVFLKTGRYGPYASHGRINASLPKDTSSDAITLEEAVSLLAANGKPAGSGRKKKAVKSKKSTKAKSKSSTAG